MSEKLITMKEYNGSSYDDLYPKNISGQVYLDATAQGVLNLPSGKTVNDAFSAMSNGGAFNVGDILVTSRTDLDDRWLLCNGETVSPYDYPNLINALPAFKTGTWFEDGIFTTSSEYKDSHSIVKLDEKWGILSANQQTSPSYATNGRVFVLSNLKNGTIADTGLGARASGAVAAVAAHVNDGKSMCGMGYAFTDLLTNPTSNQMSASNGYFIYNSNDGYYYNYSRNDSSPFNTIVKRNNLTSSATTSIIEESGSITSIGLRQFINGHMIGVGDGGSGANIHFIPILVNESGAGTRLNYNTPTGTMSNTPPIPTIQYLNGYYYGFGDTTIYRTQSLTGNNWQSWKTMPDGINSGLSYMGDNCILLTSGYTITADEQLIEWSDKPSFTNPIYIDEVNNQYISQIGTSNMYIYTPISNFIKIPTWTPADGLYAYIKAKK